VPNLNKKITILTLIATVIILSTLTFASAQTYSNVTTITGSADQTSNYFNLPSEARYEWSYTSSTPTYAALYIDVYQQGNSLPVDSMAANTNQTNGTQYLHNLQAGSYYIKVTTANLDSYTITVDSQTSTTTAPTNSPTPTAPEYSTIAILAVLAIASASLIAIKIRNKK
jgi:hypothetical protein